VRLELGPLNNNKKKRKNGPLGGSIELGPLEKEKKTQTKQTEHTMRKNVGPRRWEGLTPQKKKKFGPLGLLDKSKKIEQTMRTMRWPNTGGLHRNEI
jgi:hypothetical protein